MRTQFRDSIPLRRDLRKAQRALHEAIESEPFDSEVVNNKFESVRLAAQALQESLHRDMVSNLADLSPEERTGVYRKLMRPMLHSPPEHADQRTPGHKRHHNNGTDESH